MLQLFLSEPSWKENATDESVEQRKALLNELESVIWSVMLVEGRSESRLWLCNAVAEMRSITPRNQHICWEELEWKGKHGQSPAMVATKPHYFLDLDVERTVENFLEYVPEFWSSKEFAESLKDGDILTIDNNFFINMFVDLMYKDDLKEVWEIIDEFLIEQSFSFLCQHLLIILGEQDLMVFLDLLQNYVKPRLQKMDCHDSLDQLLEIILSKCDGNNSLDQLLLLNAVATQSRHLMRFIREEGSQEHKEKVKHVVFQICKPTNPKDSFTPILRECFKRKSLATIKWLGLQSWAFYCYLSEDFQNSSSWESLFVGNDINFRKSKTYPILDHDQFLEESESEQNSSARNKRKKRQKYRKKERRDLEIKELDGDEFADGIKNRLGLPSISSDWLLSTDGLQLDWKVRQKCRFLISVWIYVEEEYVKNGLPPVVIVTSISSPWNPALVPLLPFASAQEGILEVPFPSSLGNNYKFTTTTLQ
ncbi:putative GPN-loop GTPase 3-like, partial [Capsicum annuum]